MCFWMHKKLNRLLGMTCVYSEERNNHPIFSILDVNVQSAVHPSMSVTISFYIFHLPIFTYFRLYRLDMSLL